jgi:hypothetical protein
MNLKSLVLDDKIESQDYSINEQYGAVQAEFNERFLSNIWVSTIEQ